MKAWATGLVALALAGDIAAQIRAGEVRTAVNGSLAGARAGGAGKAGALCLGFETFDAAKLDKEVDAAAFQSVLDEQLRIAAIPVAAGKHEVTGSITDLQMAICWPNVGFGNWDKIKGTATLAMEWKVDGVAIATSASHAQPKSGPGGVKGLVGHAYAENVRQLLANPGLRTALMTPEKAVEAPVLALVPASVANDPASAADDSPPVGATPARTRGPATTGKLPLPLLQPGKPTRAAGADPLTVYAIEGGAGLSVRLSLKVVGEGGLVLHATDGTPMLESTGAGTVELAAILPGDDVYFVSVLRAKTAQPASLKLDVTEPDPHLAVFASGVGYVFQELDKNSNQPHDVRSCWLEPGLKLRRIYPDRQEEVTLGRGGREFGAWKLKSGASGARERELIFADGKVTFRTPDGSSPDAVRALADVIFFAEGDKYHRYLCGPGDS